MCYVSLGGVEFIRSLLYLCSVFVANGKLIIEKSPTGIFWTEYTYLPIVISQSYCYLKRLVYCHQFSKAGLSHAVHFGRRRSCGSMFNRLSIIRVPVPFLPYSKCAISLWTDPSPGHIVMVYLIMSPGIRVACPYLRREDTPCPISMTNGWAIVWEETSHLINTIHLLDNLFADCYLVAELGMTSCYPHDDARNSSF